MPSIPHLVNFAELDALLTGPRVATPSVAESVATGDPDMDSVEWIKYLEAENFKLGEELATSNAKLRAIMTACFAG